MNNLSQFFLVSLAVLMLTACGKNETKPEPVVEADNAEKASMPEEVTEIVESVQTEVKEIVEQAEAQISEIKAAAEETVEKEVAAVVEKAEAEVETAVQDMQKSVEKKMEESAGEEVTNKLKGLF